MKVVFLVVFLVGCQTAPPTSDVLVFDDDTRSKDDDNIITPPVLPVIAHLENDPTTLRKDVKKQRLLQNPEPSTRFGFNKGFDVSPGADGGFTASFSHGFSGLGHSQSGSHSLTVGAPSQGFQVSQSSSQSSSFGGGPSVLGSSLSGSQSSSQSSSFNGGLNGISSASSGSSANSLSGSVLGQGFSTSGSQSQSSAGSAGINGVSSAFGQGSGQAISLPNGQTIANGQSSSGAFGNGAIGAASGGGFAQNGNGFSGTAANSQSLASVQSGRGPLTTGGQSSGFGQSSAFGQSSGFAQSGGFGQASGFEQPNRFGQSSGFGGQRLPNRQFSLTDSDSTIRFPGPISNRYPKFNYRPFSATSWQQPYRQNNRRKPGQYQIIRIEV